jgi:antitoxin MazE
VVTKIIPIGNSKGIRIPNRILKQLEIDDRIELVFDEQSREITLRPVRAARAGWNDAFKKMHATGQDELIIDDSIDLHDWEW